MKIFVFVLLLFALISAKEYSLNELIDSAYKHSHLLAIADMNMKSNIDVIDNAKRNMLPRVTFSGNYSYAITPYNSMTDIFFNDVLPFTETYKNYILSGDRRGDTLITSMLDYTFGNFNNLPRHSLSGGFDIRQPIFAQNKLRHAVEYARVEGRALICRWQDVLMKVKAEMTRMYYSALLAGEQTKIEEQSRIIAESRHSQTLLLFNSQILSELDTLNSFIDFSQSSIRLAEAKRSEHEIYRSIAVAAGLKESADSIILSDTIKQSAYIFNYDTLVTHFLAENKDLRFLANEADLAELRVKMSKDDYYPVIFGGLLLNRYANFQGHEDYAPERKVYLGLTYDITPFGQRRIRVKQRETELTIAKRNFEHLKEQLLLVLKSNFEKITEEYSKIEEGKKILSAAEKALSIAQNRYINGQISQTDIDVAEQRFRQSGLSYWTAVSRYNSLLIDLRIMGADYLYEPVESVENKLFDDFEEFYLREE